MRGPRGNDPRKGAPYPSRGISPIFSKLYQRSLSFIDELISYLSGAIALLHRRSKTQFHHTWDHLFHGYRKTGEMLLSFCLFGDQHARLFEHCWYQSYHHLYLHTHHLLVFRLCSCYVIGANGFLGPHLINVLSAELYDVVATDKPEGRGHEPEAQQTL